MIRGGPKFVGYVGKLPPWLPIVLTTFVALILRLYGIEQRSLWLDEMTSIEVSSNRIVDILQGVGFDNHTPPLYYLLLHCWFWIIPKDEFGLRLFSCLIDVINVYLVYIIFAKQVSNKWHGICTALAYAVSPFNIYYAQEGRMYPLLIFLALLLYQCHLQLFNRLSIRGGLSAIFIGVAGLYTHYYYLLFLFCLTLGIVVVYRKNIRFVLSWVLIVFIASALFLPWVGVVGQLVVGGGQEFRKFLFLVLPYSFFRFVAGYGVMPMRIGMKENILPVLWEFLFPLLIYGVFCGVLFFRGLQKLLKSKNSQNYLLLFIVIGVPLIALFISLKVPLLSERYLTVISPFFIAILLVGVIALAQRFSLTLYIFIPLVIYPLSQHFFNPNFGFTDWRGAAAVVQEQLPQGASVVVNRDYNQILLKYYLRGRFNIVPLDCSRVSELDQESVQKLYNAENLKIVLVETMEVTSCRERLTDHKFKITSEQISPYENGLRVMFLEK